MARTAHGYYDDFLGVNVTDFRNNGVLVKKRLNYGDGTFVDLLYEDGMPRRINWYKGGDLFISHAISED